MWCVYLLECNDGSLYCGITNNIDKRINTHNAGNGSKYVASRLPAKLVWYRDVGTQGEALREEYKIKRLSRAHKLSMIGTV